MKEENDKILNLNSKLIIGVLGSVLVIPIIINILLFIPYPPTPSDLGNKEWLSFWGSFLGGCFGGVATLFAVYYTLKQNILHNEKIIKKQDEKTRLEVLPYIDVKLYLEKSNSNLGRFIFKDLFPDEDENSEEVEDQEELIQFPSGYVLFKKDKVYYSTKLQEKYKKILSQGGLSERKDGNGVITIYDTYIRKVALTLCNIGIYAAIDVTLELCNENFNDYAIMPSFNLRVGDIVYLYFIFDYGTLEDNFIINVKFNDIYENSYIQSFQIILENESNKLTRITSPKQL